MYKCVTSSWPCF